MTYRQPSRSPELPTAGYGYVVPQCAGSSRKGPIPAADPSNKRARWGRRYQAAPAPILAPGRRSFKAADGRKDDSPYLTWSPPEMKSRRSGRRRRRRRRPRKSGPLVRRARLFDLDPKTPSSPSEGCCVPVCRREVPGEPLGGESLPGAAPVGAGGLCTNCRRETAMYQVKIAEVPPLEEELVVISDDQGEILAELDGRPAAVVWLRAHGCDAVDCDIVSSVPADYRISVNITK